MSMFNPKIAVIGLGYVGLPVALALAEKFEAVYGFDIHEPRIRELKNAIDRTNETSAEELKNTSLNFTSDPKEIAQCNFYIVCVPTPIDGNRQPDLTPVRKASETVGSVLKKGDIVVYESTVYPGVTEEICGPVLARVSGLKQGHDFKLGYSPERINPGDKEHTLSRIVKIVSGEDHETLETIADVYSKIITAGLHKAQSIKVAEAAKVIENIQRDLNIALMNELSIIFDKLNIRTTDVLAAARTKWNFMPFTPGLVGGHCIGVDPYYLTAKAEQVGYSPHVILSGRRINDGMGAYIAQKTVRLMNANDMKIKGARVAIFGMTFKENVPDIRNSRVPDIVQELQSFGIAPMVYDPLADAAEVHEEYGINLTTDTMPQSLDAVILSVPHKAYITSGPNHFAAMLKPGGVVIDVKSMFAPADFPGHIYWSL